MVTGSARRAWLLAMLCGALAACGGGDKPAAPAQNDGKRAVSGVVMKGAVQGATVKFYGINDDGTANPDALVATVTTSADGTFTAALPSSSVHLLAQTFDGSFVDEADPAATGRRRIALPPSPTVGFEAVLPPGATTLAITPYAHAMLIKARLQAAGTNFANVFDAVRTQATTAFGFDPITKVPADPLSPSDTATAAALQYAILLGAAAQSINAIATAAGHLPDFADVMLFVDDLGDGSFSLVDFAAQVRRFRNNNFALYQGVPLPVLDEALLSQPADLPAGGQVVLPYLTNAGELKLFDPDDPTNPVFVEGGLSTTDFTWRTLMKASVTGGIASNIAPARIVYISSDGTLKKVNLEPGQSRSAVQVSSIADACRINGIAEDFANPDNSIVRVDTAGDNGTCEGGSGDDSTTAEAWLVPLSTGAGAPGVGIGEGYCCGVTGIGTPGGALTGVLVAEDNDGSDGTFLLRRRNVGTLGSAVEIATLEISGSGQTYGSLQRGMGDQHLYVRAVRFGVDTTYKILRFNVATDDLTEMYDYGVSDGSLFGESFDHALFDSANLYFLKPDGSELLAIPHSGGVPNSLFTPPAGTKINGIAQAGDRIAIEASSADGTQGGVYSVLKAGGSQVPLASNTSSSTSRLSGTNGPLVLIDTTSGTSVLSYTASAITADGSGGFGNVTDAQWAGEVFQTTCDFNEACEESVLAQTLYLRRLASTNGAQLELATTTTGAPTGTYVGSISNVFEGPAAFVFGFGDYGQVTVFASIEQSNLFLADSTQASATPPGTALVAVANAPGGDNRWLLFGDGDGGGGGGGGTDSDFDGLTDEVEIALGTDPFNPDSDADGLLDGDEVNVYGTNPLNADTDGDGLSDGSEIGQTGTDALAPDTDADGVGDGIEFANGSDAVATVNPVIYANAACGAGCDGLSWSTGFNSQLDVLAAIDANGSGGVSAAQTLFVLYAPGSYGSLALTDTPRAHLALAGSLGAGVYAAAFPPSTTFDAQGSGPALRLANVVPITAQDIAFTGGSNPQGGGVMLDVAATPVQLTLRRAHIHGNTAEQGGGIALLAEAATSDDYLQIEDSLIEGNLASSSTATAAGGGIYMTDGSLTLINTKIDNNQASGTNAAALGGGLHVAAAGLGVVVRDSEFSANRVFGDAAQRGAGGGIHLDGSAFLDFHMEFSRVLRNETSGLVDPTSGGAGLYAGGNSRVLVEVSVFADNRASNGPGGGINAIDVPDVNVEHSQFLSNGSARPGGGFHAHVPAGGLAAAFNNLFVGNVATDPDADGGAIEIENLQATPGALALASNTVAYNQITTNTAGLAGGVSVNSVNSADTFRNNIVWFNDNASVDDPVAAAQPGDNLFFDNVLTASGNNVNESAFPGNSVIADPLFTLGFYLDPLSSSVDAGDDTAANVFFSSFAAPFTTDPSGSADTGTVDIGFHQAEGKTADGAVTGASAFANPVSAGCPAANVNVTLSSADGPVGAGHIVAVDNLSGGTGSETLSALTTLDPLQSGTSVLAIDQGDGLYRVGLSGSSAGTYGFDVYVDGAGPFPASFGCN